MSGLDGLAIATMIAVCGFVWGGFAVLLTRAIRREGAKRRDDRGPGR